MTQCIIIINKNALGHFTLYCQLIFSYANVFQSGFIRVVDFTMFSLFPIAKPESFLSYYETWTISASVSQQKTNKLVICIFKFYLLFTSNRNKDFYFSLLKLEQYLVSILF